jgi:glucuronate isomerase
MTALWLRGDHYKWRAMRTAGVNERFRTGDATDWEKFEQYAADAAFDVQVRPTWRPDKALISYHNARRYFGFYEK